MRIFFIGFRWEFLRCYINSTKHSSEHMIKGLHKCWFTQLSFPFFYFTYAPWELKVSLQFWCFMGPKALNQISLLWKQNTVFFCSCNQGWKAVEEGTHWFRLTALTGQTSLRQITSVLISEMNKRMVQEFLVWYMNGKSRQYGFCWGGVWFLNYLNIGRRAFWARHERIF